MRSVSVCTSLTHCIVCSHPACVIVGRHRCCSLAAMGALEYPKKNCRNGNKEELYFTLYIAYYVILHITHRNQIFLFCLDGIEYTAWHARYKYFVLYLCIK